MISLKNKAILVFIKNFRKGKQNHYDFKVSLASSDIVYKVPYKLRMLHQNFIKTYLFNDNQLYYSFILVLIQFITWPNFKYTFPN